MVLTILYRLSYSLCENGAYTIATRLICQQNQSIIKIDTYRTQLERFIVFHFPLRTQLLDVYTQDSHHHQV
jgi:hypothetical protein